MRAHFCCITLRAISYPQNPILWNNKHINSTLLCIIYPTPCYFIMQSNRIIQIILYCVYAMPVIELYMIYFHKIFATWCIFSSFVSAHFSTSFSRFLFYFLFSFILGGNGGMQSEGTYLLFNIYMIFIGR